MPPYILDYERPRHATEVPPALLLGAAPARLRLSGSYYERPRHATEVPPALLLGAAPARLRLSGSSTMRDGIAVATAHRKGKPGVPNALGSRFPKSL